MIFKVGSESRICLDDESASAEEITAFPGVQFLVKKPVPEFVQNEGT